MWRDALRTIGRKHASFLGLSLLLMAYLSVRDDTTPGDLALGGGLVAALWILIGIRVVMRAGERRGPDRGKPYAG